MLAKKQFNGAVARLRAMATTPDLIQMLTHQLTKANADGEHNELLALLSKAEPQLKGTTLLDRRRAENYLANALYGRNHSQVVHMLPKDNQPEIARSGVKAPADAALPLKEKLLYNLISQLSSQSQHPSSNKAGMTLSDYGLALSRQLGEANDAVRNFHVSITGVEQPRTVYASYAFHVAIVFVTFLDIEMRIELAYAREVHSPVVDAVFESHTIVCEQGTKTYADSLREKKGIETNSQAVHSFFENIALSLVQCATPELLHRGDLLSKTYPQSYINQQSILVVEAYNATSAAEVHLRYLMLKELRALSNELKKDSSTDAEVKRLLMKLTRTDPVPNCFLFTYQGKAFLERLAQLTKEPWAVDQADRPSVESAAARITLENTYDHVNLVMTLRIKRTSSNDRWYAVDLGDALEEATLTLNGRFVSDYETHPRFWRAFMEMTANHSELVWKAMQYNQRD